MPILTISESFTGHVGQKVLGTYYNAICEALENHGKDADLLRMFADDSVEGSELSVIKFAGAKALQHDIDLIRSKLPLAMPDISVKLLEPGDVFRGVYPVDDFRAKPTTRIASKCAALPAESLGITVVVNMCNIDGQEGLSKAAKRTFATLASNALAESLPNLVITKPSEFLADDVRFLFKASEGETKTDVFFSSSARDVPEISSKIRSCICSAMEHVAQSDVGGDKRLLNAPVEMQLCSHMLTGRGIGQQL